MKHILFLILLTFPFVFSSCSSDDEEKEPLPPRDYQTIVGNTYIRCEVGSPFKYHIYKFKEDGTIDVEVRLKSSDGELERKSIGYYEYNHPILKLKVQSIKGCDDCFNNFEATVSKDRRLFKFTTWNDYLYVWYVFDYYYHEMK